MFNVLKQMSLEEFYDGRRYPANTHGGYELISPLNHVTVLNLPISAIMGSDSELLFGYQSHIITYHEILNRMFNLGVQLNKYDIDSQFLFVNEVASLLEKHMNN